MKKSIQTSALLAIAIAMTGTLSFAATPGEATYKAKCAVCHGATGTPSAGMAKMMAIKSASDPTIKALTEAQMATAVKAGKGKMKPIAGLSDAEIKDVVGYYRTLN